MSLRSCHAGKVYTADRKKHGRHVLVKMKNGREYYLPHFVRHSPDGLEWGYGGSGPADLALSLLTDAVGPVLARLHYQDFKWAVVNGLDHEGWQLSHESIASWVTKQEKTMEGGGD